MGVWGYANFLIQLHASVQLQTIKQVAWDDSALPPFRNGIGAPQSHSLGTRIRDQGMGINSKTQR